MDHGDVLPVRVVVVDVKRMDRTGPHHRVPHKREDDVGPRGVLILREVAENFLGAIGFEHHVTNVLSVS